MTWNNPQRGIRGRSLVAVACLCIAALWCGSAQAERRWNGTQWVDVKPAIPGTPAGDIVAVRALVEARRNEEAVHKAEEFLGRHTKSPLCEEALNLAGIATMQRGHYWDAYHWFERQIEDFPNGPMLNRALDREYQVGEAFLEGRKRRVMTILKLSAVDEGIEILDKISEHAPGSYIARKALLRIAKYHFDTTEYDEAVKRYDEFVKRYPNSPKRSSAMIQAARGSLLKYRGVKWDSDPLHEAAARYRVIQAAYPKAAEAEGVASILSEIRATLAHKLYHTGLFYERIQQPRAAAYYYALVVRDYRTTRWAGDAKTRLRVLGNIIPVEPNLLPKDFKPDASKALSSMPTPLDRAPEVKHETKPEVKTPSAIPEDKPIPMRDLLKRLRKSRQIEPAKD